MPNLSGKRIGSIDVTRRNTGLNVLVTNNLSKAYKGHFAVKNVSMHIEKGDIYGFVGENGAGKRH